VRVACPAKINTFLSVGPPDTTGYHPIRTIFQAVGLFDYLTIVPAQDGVAEVTSDWADLPRENTLTKVLRFCGELIDIPPLKIHLEKNIPSQAGLGGGSSDAAGLLRGLEAMLGSFAMSHKEMVAEAVGADVPFFLVGGRAKGEGYGQILTPLPDPQPMWAVIAKPSIGISTADAYARLDAEEREWKPFPENESEFYNDFERVMPCDIDDMREHLLVKKASMAGLSGSGSAVFGLFSSVELANHASEGLRRDAEVFVVPLLTREESLWIS
jgi:4-diphosphocytidyl-2-C-methyl-D-erythritol kinase